MTLFFGLFSAYFPYFDLDVARYIFFQNMENPLENSLEKYRNKLFPLLKSKGLDKKDAKKRPKISEKQYHNSQ